MSESSPMYFDLGGKRALVSGGASGIGLATVRLLARSGAHVAVNDLPGNPALEETVAALAGEGLKVAGVAGDVGEAHSARDIVGRALDVLGGLDYLVNNAATPNTRSVIPVAELERMSEAFWRKIIDVNLMSVFRMTHAAAPALTRAGGAVVNTASISGFGGGGSSMAYSTSKAAVIALTRELARALAPQVRVNAIAPGMVESNWECEFPDREQRARERTPLRRVGQPGDYAEAIVFLAASGRYITGQTLVVDGGLRS